MPSVKPCQIKKYPGINLMKETQDLYILKKQETPIKYCGKFKEKLNKYKDTSHSDTKSLQIVKKMINKDQ